MNTLKERAQDVLEKWKKAASEWEEAEVGHEMATLLRELIDAPEPNPSMWQIFGDDWSTETNFLAVAEYYRNEGCKVVAYYATPPANNQSEYHLEMVNQPAPSVPALTVECEPDYWSGGHYHEGTLPHIDPTTVWKLPIGTELYTAPPTPSVPDAELVQRLIDIEQRIKTLETNIEKEL